MKPRPYQAVVLEPHALSSEDIKPTPAGNEVDEEERELMPLAYSSTILVPKPDSAKDLVPIPASAEEV